MRNPLFIVFLITVLILIDFYIYHVLKTLVQGASIGTKNGITIIYWALCILSLSSFLLFPYVVNPYFKQYLFSIGIGWVLTQIFMVLFFLVDDLRRGAFWTMGQVASAAGAKFLNTEKGIQDLLF